MSIESQILRIQQNVADAFLAIGEMGGTVPQPVSSDNLASSVRSIPSGSGSGGSPVGTIISYMGKTAPDGYLICDGGVKNVSDYPALAQHFKTQFGSANYFGGNGTTTFAVPDMRNLFLRGFHGSASALSGEVGKRQDATEHPYVKWQWSSRWGGSGRSPNNSNSTLVAPKNSDSVSGTIYSSFINTTDDNDADERLPTIYTSRPVNMAVLYCIKAG